MTFWYVLLCLIHLILCFHHNHFPFSLGGIRVWTQGSEIVRQTLYHLIHAVSPFGSGYFGDRGLFVPKMGSTVILLFYAPFCYWDDRCTPPRPVLVDKRSCERFVQTVLKLQSIWSQGYIFMQMKLKDSAEYTESSHTGEM
jgi:hypothetical protein